MDKIDSLCKTQMLNIDKILCQNRLLRATTGLNRKAFENLLLNFESVYLSLSWSKERECPRKRHEGGGRKSHLKTIQHKLFYILFYFKCYPTFDLAGILFDFDRSQAHRWVHRLQLVLEETLNQKQVLPKRKIGTIQEFTQYFPGVKKVIIDGVERPINRPKDKEKQKENYSGKKKRHTRKNLAMVSPEKKILQLTPTCSGKIHDKKIHDNFDVTGGIPDEIEVLADSGFQGVQKDYENVRLPHKKPRGGELTVEKKEENRELSQERVLCENAFSGVKRYNAVSSIYRNRVSEFDDKLMITACGLWNLYLEVA
jgi:hypothetical protein